MNFCQYWGLNIEIDSIKMNNIEKGLNNLFSKEDNPQKLTDFVLKFIKSTKGGINEFISAMNPEYELIVDINIIMRDFHEKYPQARSIDSVSAENLFIKYYNENINTMINIYNSYYEPLGIKINFVPYK